MKAFLYGVGLQFKMDIRSKTMLITCYLVPLVFFFFMSGYCFKEKYLLPPPITFVNKRIRGLYIPYVKWSLLFLLLHNVFYYLNIYNDEYGLNGNVSHLYTWEGMGKRAIHIAAGLHGTEQLLGGYWFLPQLLYASIMGLVVIKYIRNIYVGCALVLSSAIVTSLFNLRVPFWEIGSLSMLSTAFFIIGYAYKKKYDNWNKGYLSVLFIIIVTIGSVYCHTSMLSFTTENILPYAICAVCGTVMTLNFSQYIASKEGWIKNILIYVGNNTLTVLTWHFLCFKIVTLVIIQLYSLPIEQLACFPILPQYANYWPLYTLAGAGIPLTIKHLLHKAKLKS